MRFRTHLLLLALLLGGSLGLDAQEPKKEIKKDEKKDENKDEKKEPKTDAPASPLAKVDIEKVTFNTADGVELQGSFYKSLKGGGSPSVLLLHSIGKDPNSKDGNNQGYDGLAKILANAGFNVMRFDFRGHGNSTKFDKSLFWDPAYGNDKAMPTLSRRKPTPDTLEMKDVTTARGNYLPMLANDVMAARIALDKMNDSGKTNTGSTYIIAATDATAIGMLFMAAEWTRPQTVPQAWNLSSIPPPRREVPQGSDFAGKDIAGAIWLSPALVKGIDLTLLKKWVKEFPEMREKNPVYCLYGADDANAKTTSRVMIEDVLMANPTRKELSKLTFTTLEAVPGTKLAGVNLLGGALGTEKLIVKQLEALELARKNVIATPNRNYTKAPILYPSLFGVR